MIQHPRFSFWESERISLTLSKLVESWKFSRDHSYSFFNLEREPWRKPGNWYKETRSSGLARARWVMVTILSLFRMNGFSRTSLSGLRLIDNFGFYRK